MITLNVPCIINKKLVYQQETVYEVRDFPYFEMAFLDTVRKGNKATYYNVAAAFDIESTTIEPLKIDGKYVTDPYAFMYHWQFCINDKVCFGRTWEEFKEFFKRLSERMDLSNHKKLAVYVHNLAYEFQFMKEFIDIESMFCKDTRKPLKITCTNGIEFRCSYFLSNMSLIKFCENSELCIHYKLDDTFDYRLIRTPGTQLTETEQAYCYNDVRGLCECIDTLLQDDNIATIPLTNTGYVRRECRIAMSKNKSNWYKFNEIQLNKEEYLMCKRAFRGGDTHANRIYTNKILENVFSFDLKSSYPSWMLIDYYPTSKFMKCDLNNTYKTEYYCRNYCVVMDITIHKPRIKPNTPFPYIDIAHCYQRANVVNDNGRVLSADMVTMTITNVDFEIIQKEYDFDFYKVNNAIYANKGKLPKELRLKIIDYFERKTALDKVEGKEYEYAKSKNRINAIFGMSVSDIAHDEIEYNVDTMEWTQTASDIDEELEKFYRSRNNFMSYQHGIFVTANARRRLHTMIQRVGMDCVYIDTDCIKFIGSHNIEKFEKESEHIILECERNDIPAFIIKKDGSKQYFGIWDSEGILERFKTLGAKKYCYHKDGHFIITVAGMNKVKGSNKIGSIDHFNIGETLENVGRTTSYFNDEKEHLIKVNGEIFTTASNIGIVDTTYTIGITNEYWEIMNTEV